jgi:hypothetical protein
VCVPLFSEETIYAAFFTDMVSINYRNLIKIVRTIFEKIAIVFLSPYFWSGNVHIHQAPTYDG